MAPSLRADHQTTLSGEIRSAKRGAEPPCSADLPRGGGGQRHPASCRIQDRRLWGTWGRRPSRSSGPTRPARRPRNGPTRSAPSDVRPTREATSTTDVLDHLEHGLIRLLHHAQVHQHVVECQTSTEAAVAPQPKPCRFSTGAKLGSTNSRRLTRVGWAPWCATGDHRLHRVAGLARNRS